MRGARSSAPWRHPALAPVYGAVVAFVAVLLAGPVIAEQAELTVTVDGPRPDDLRVQLLDDAGQVLDDGPLDGDTWSTDLAAAAGHRLCLLTAAPTRLADTRPADRCTARPAEPQLRVAVQPVRVVAENASAADAPFEEARVVVLDPGGSRVGDPAPLDGDGRLDLPEAANGRQVCLRPPPGWQVVDDPRPLACRKVREDQVEDVVFALERSS